MDTKNESTIIETVSILIGPINFTDAHICERSNYVIQSVCMAIIDYMVKKGIDLAKIDLIPSTKVRGSFFNIEGIINLIKTNNLYTNFNNTCEIYEQLKEVLLKAISTLF